MKTIDDILDQKICTGRYQYIIFSVVSLIDFCNGIIYVGMSILLPILQNMWGLDQNQMVLLGSISFVGSGFGNYIYAYVTDSIGRKTTLMIFTSISFITFIYASVIDSFIQMLLFITQFNPQLSCMFQRVLNKSIEEDLEALQLWYLLWENFMSYLLCYIFLDDYTTGQLEKSVEILLDSCWYFVFGNCRYRDAFEQINEAIIANKNQELINDYEKDGLIKWMNLMKQNDQSKAQFSGLFSRTYLKYTIRLWIINLGANFQSLNIFLLVPLLLNSAGQGFESMAYIFLTEQAALIVLNFVIDTKKGGRVNIIFFASFLNIFSNALIFLRKEKFLLIGMIIMIIGNRATFATINILACESYASNYRSLGVGYGQFVGAIPGIIGPYIIFQLYAIEPYLPFVLITNDFFLDSYHQYNRNLFFNLQFYYPVICQVEYQQNRSNN
ncbi:hypothetical protein pb186bvf_019981 [Paramecium bursaria]